MPAVILFLVTLLVPAARARPCSAKRSGAQPRVSTEGANDTSIPCAVGTYPINRGATLHVTTTEPPYALCLRHDQVVDNGVRTLGRWPDCDELPGLLPAPQSKMFVDVGANIGACALLMAARGHRVIAFEPTPATFAALAAGVAGNTQLGLIPHMDVRLVNAAASNASGRGVIYSMPGNAGNSVTTGAQGSRPRSRNKYIFNRKYEPHEIRMTTLDDDVQTPANEIGLMKIDTQGHEQRVLRGATRLLTGPSRVATIKLEFAPAHILNVGDQPIEILRMLSAAGYRLEDVGGGNTGRTDPRPLRPPGFKAFVAGMKNRFGDVVARLQET